MYRGSQYAIMGTGGFQMADSAKQIKLQSVPNVAKIDVSLAAQFLFPSDVLNTLLQSNPSDQNILRISSETFLSNILSPDSILSVGNFENLFEKYTDDVQSKMGVPFKYSSIFSISTQESGRIFNAKSLYDLLQGCLASELGEIVPALTGEILLLDVSRTLSDIRRMNLFANVGASSRNRFMPGDLIYVSDGISITMTTDLSVKTDILSILQKRFSSEMDVIPTKESLGDFNNTVSSSIMLRLI